MALKRKIHSVGFELSTGVGKTKGEVDDSPKVDPLVTTLDDLPCDIVRIILLKLPLKSVLACKCVSKSWYSITLDPHFAEIHSLCAPTPTIALVRTSDPKCVSRTLHLLKFDEFQSNEAHNMPSDNVLGRGCSLDKVKSKEAKNLTSGNGRGHLCSCKAIPMPDCDNHMKLEVKFKLPLCDSKMVLDTMLEARRRGHRWNNILCSKPKDDKFDVVNSCNGLICLWDHVEKKPKGFCNRKTFVVCNPITGEFIRLPSPKFDIEMKCNLVNSGFGYVKNTNEYKVVRIFPRGMVHDDDGVIEIHTLGTRSWRNINYHGPSWFHIKSPTFLNGSLHWLVRYGNADSILSFDLESETLDSFPCPFGKPSFETGFGEFKGRLYVSRVFPDKNSIAFFTMRRYGDGKSWMVFVHLNIEDFFNGPLLYKPRVVIGGDGIWISDHSRFFIYCDVEKHSVKFLEGRGTSFELEPIFLIPSLIRLKDVLKSDDIEVLNIHSRCATFKLREDEEVLYLAKYQADSKMDRKRICISSISC